MRKIQNTCRLSAVSKASLHRRHLCRRRVTWKARICPSNASWFGASTPHSVQQLTVDKLCDFRCNFRRYLLLSQRPQIVHISLLSSLVSFFGFSVECCDWMCLFKWPVCWKPLPQISHTIFALSIFPKWTNCSCLLRLSSSLNLWKWRQFISIWGYLSDWRAAYFKLQNRQRYGFATKLWRYFMWSRRERRKKKCLLIIIEVNREYCDKYRTC